MSNKNIFYLVLTLILAGLSFTILLPFLSVIVLAYIFSVLLKPVNRYFKRYFNGTLSAISTILFFIIVILTPFTFVFTNIIIEGQNFYASISDTNYASIQNFVISNLPESVEPYLKTIKLDAVAKSISSFIISNLSGVLSGTVDIILKLFLFLMVLFYLLKDSKNIKNHYRQISPLSDDESDKLKNNFKASINSILLGSLFVSLAQGAVSAIGFYIFDVPNAIFLGATAGLLALLPGVGPAIVWLPVAVFLYINDSSNFNWLYQIIWGIVAVGLIDNLLGPLIINKGIKINQVFILLSIIGGIYYFGPEGFIYGPLILSMFMTVTTSWRDSFIIKDIQE